MAEKYDTKKGADYVWLRGVAIDNKDYERVNHIQELEKLVKEGVPYSGENPIFRLGLQDNNLWLRESDAWVAMVLYTEIFKERDHTALPGFDGKSAKYILDLGANIGIYTLRIKRNNSDCRILCVEPDPAMFDLLSRNMESNKLQKISLINLAASDKTGFTQLGCIPECGGITGKYLGKIKLSSRTWVNPDRIKQAIYKIME